MIIGTLYDCTVYQKELENLTSVEKSEQQQSNLLIFYILAISFLNFHRCNKNKNSQIILSSYQKQYENILKNLLLISLTK